MSSLDVIDVEYNSRRWKLLEKIRKETVKMMKPLINAHILSIAYGSIARGDVTETSDIDIFIPTPPAPTLIEAILSRQEMSFMSRQIIQATPSYAAKAFIYVEEDRSYSFPLVPLKINEVEFYRYAGSITHEQLQENIRVLGVDKRLILIEPTVKGHTETYVIGKEGLTARKLEVNLSIVIERVRTLERRGKVGRTGVYIKRELSPDETFGNAFNELSRSRPALRRRTRIK
jgi:predicted nucleotidyltransferase